VVAAPVQLVVRVAGRMASRRLISGMVSRIFPGSGGVPGQGWPGPGSRCDPRGGGGDGADGQGGYDQHGVPGDRGVEPDPGLIEPEAILTGSEIL
jgi:hypothetical protein